MKTKRLPHIEVIVPVFNEVQSISPLLEELDRVTQHLSAHAIISILFVNDGSTDGTGTLLERLHREKSNIRVIELLHNFGHSAAISAGIDHFQGDIAVIMDADLQDDPKAIVDMFIAWQNGSKTVVAARGNRQETGKAAFKAFYFLLHKVSPQLPPINFGTYCLLDKSVVQRVRALKEQHRYFPGLVSFVSDKVTPVLVDRNARQHGTSRVGAFGLIQLALTAFVSFSARPVRAVSLLGVAASLLAVMGASLIVSIKLFTPYAIPGWASIMTALLFGSGVQMFCLGIIGEYVARIYDEVKGRPLYLVGRELDHSAISSSKKNSVA